MVSRIADSAPVVRLTRGRLWIGLLTALLVGIVALNVLALSFSAASTRVGHESDILERQNSALRARIANGLSNNRIQRTAESLGYVTPDPGAIRYLSPAADDAATAARRIASGSLSSDGAVAVEPTAPVTTATTTATTPTTP
jgi:hypothetical protein